MGYAQTSIVFYGVEIPAKVAEKIFNDPKLQAENQNPDWEGFRIPGPRVYRALDVSDPKSKQLVQPTPASPYPAHESCAMEYEVIYPTLISDGSDSRIHNLQCDTEDGCPTYLGVFIASKGYAFQDKIAYFVKNLPPEAVNIFQVAVAPILAQYGITSAPEVHIIQQVW
jgi:hypothetical protein